MEYIKNHTVFKDDGMSRLMRFATKNDEKKGFFNEKISDSESSDENDWMADYWGLT